MNGLFMTPGGLLPFLTQQLNYTYKILFIYLLFLLYLTKMYFYDQMLWFQTKIMSDCWLLGGLVRCPPLILAFCFQTESPPSGLFFQHKVDPWLDIAQFSVVNWSSLKIFMKKRFFIFREEHITYWHIFHHKQNCEIQMNSPVALKTYIFVINVSTV